MESEFWESGAPWSPLRNFISSRANPIKRRKNEGGRESVGQSGGVDAKCLQSMSGGSEKLADKSRTRTKRERYTQRVLPLPLDDRAGPYLSLAFFRPSPFHHPLTARPFLELVVFFSLSILSLFLSARTIFIKPEGEKWLSSILVIAIGRGEETVNENREEDGIGVDGAKNRGKNRELNWGIWIINGYLNIYSVWYISMIRSHLDRNFFLYFRFNWNDNLNIYIYYVMSMIYSIFSSGETNNFLCT